MLPLENPDTAHHLDCYQQPHCKQACYLEEKIECGTTVSTTVTMPDKLPAASRFRISLCKRSHTWAAQYLRSR